MITLPQAPKVIEKKDNFAKFEIEGLYPGYGVTIGNSLRRILFSSLAGAAVTQVKIKGAQHEFSTLPGVLEDVVMILMNLKLMRFKVFSDDPQTAHLKIKGEKKVKGSDFKFPTQVELVNKSCHIATLTDKKADLDIEIQIEKGVGYEPVDRRKKTKKSEAGVLPLDAIFTPIKRINYKIENMRVGERTDFDRLIFDVETDGTISPENAFFQAAEILVDHFSMIADPFRPAPEVPVAPKIKKAADEDLTKVPADDLNFSARTLKALSSNGLKTAGGIARKSEKSLLGLEGIGEGGVKEIKKALKKLGLELKEDKSKKE